MVGIPNYKTDIQCKRFIAWMDMHANSIIKQSMLFENEILKQSNSSNVAIMFYNWVFRGYYSPSAILPGVYSIHQSTKIHYSPLPHNQNMQWLHHRIQKPSLRWYYLNKELIQCFKKIPRNYHWNQQWMACYSNWQYSEQEPRFQFVLSL